MKLRYIFPLIVLYGCLVWVNYLALIPIAVFGGYGIYKAWQVRNIKRDIETGDWSKVLAAVDSMFDGDERGKEIAKIVEDVAVKRYGGPRAILRDAGIFMVGEAE